jgi:hypothetical protein
VPNLVTSLNQILRFEWYVVTCDPNNGYQKDMCPKEIGLHARDMITILGSAVYQIGRDLYDHFDNKIFTYTPKMIRIVTTTSI